jgi:hypothetical protein
VRVLKSFSRTQAYLPAALQARVIGATWHSAMARHHEGAHRIDASWFSELTRMPRSRDTLRDLGCGPNIGWPSTTTARAGPSRCATTWSRRMGRWACERVDTVRPDQRLQGMAASTLSGK